jgi:hypothetical protein
MGRSKAKQAAKAERKKKKKCRPQGKGAKQRHMKKQGKKLIKRVRRWRIDLNRRRHVQSYREITPRVSFGTQKKLCEPLDLCPTVMDFYIRHAGYNPWLEVSDRYNVSNPEGIEGGGKGVFALQDIPPHTLLCPYVGTPWICACKDNTRADHVEFRDCQYDLRVHSEFYICAREDTHDTAYLNALDLENLMGGDGVISTYRTPPNFGRYFNTLRKGQEGKFNCSFLPDADGFEVIFIWSGDEVVKRGEELLIDYGTEFSLPLDEEEEEEEEEVEEEA